MRFLPVVERELRVAARRRLTYWTRFGAGLIAIFLGAWIWMSFPTGSRDGEIAKALFYGISGLSFFFAFLSGLIITSDCISEEKRDGTLGLLFLTDLKGYDVVFGKLVATSLNAFYRLLAVLPVLAIPLLLGSLTVGEFWRMCGVLVNTLFFSLCAGMLASAISRHQRKAIATTFFLLLLVAAGPPAVGWARVIAANDPTQFQPLWLVTSPLYSYVLSFDRSFRTGGQHFWISISVIHALGWIFLIFASFIVPRTWQDRPAGSARLRWSERWARWAYGSAAQRRSYRERLLGVNPYFWLAARSRLKPALVLGFLGLAGALWLWIALKYPREAFDPGMYIMTAMILHTVIKLWVAAEASWTVAEDRRAGTLELILSTPILVREIVRGQHYALWRQFGAAISIILVADGVMFFASLEAQDRRDVWLTMFLVGVGMFVADLYVISWVGMWLGLTAKRASNASSGTVGRVLILPWVLFFMILTFVGLLNPSGFNPEPQFFFLLWFALGIVVDILFLVSARANLLEQFRVVATERFGDPRPWWKKLLFAEKQPPRLPGS